MEDQEKKKKEISDLKNVQLTGDSIYWEDFDKDFLIKVLVQWAGAVKDLTGGIDGFHGTIMKRYGWEVAMEISKEVWCNYAKKHMLRYAEIAKVNPQNVEEALKAIFLSVDGSARSRKMTKEEMRENTIRAEQEIINPNHIKAKCEWCTYFDELVKGVEVLGMDHETADKMLKDICSMDIEIGACYFESALPGKKVRGRLLKAPSMKTKDQAPICIQEYKVVEE